MACTKPWTGYRWADGTVRDKPSLGSRLSTPIQLACNKCLDCRIEKSRQWAIRCQHEASLHRHTDGSSRNCFLTLTYNEETLPANLSLDKREWQLFAHRLRKTVGAFRYLHVGEYGDENKRPHYHALIFGQDFSEDRECMTSESGHPYYVSPTLTKLWPKGFHIIGDVVPETINYVCRYQQKKILGTSPEAEARRSRAYTRVDGITGEVWEVAPEYATMSLKPGIGDGWWDRFKGDLFPDDFAIYRGQKARTPDYYLKKLETEDPTTWSNVKAKRKKWAAARAADNTPERLAAKAAITVARTKLKSQRKLD